MAFWSSRSWLNRLDRFQGLETPNANSPAPPPGTVGPPDYTPGDPHGLAITPLEDIVQNRSLPGLNASPWSGLPSEWETPAFQSTQVGIKKLIDIAWACLDLNTNVVSAMPVYRTQNGGIIEPTTWMSNPDPTIYNSWQEFAKQLFWDFWLGEAFVLPMSYTYDDRPFNFRVIPPFLVNAEMRSGGTRGYKFGGTDVTGKILHIRYYSTSTNPRGIGPLEVAGARMTAIGLLQRYANTLAETGGIPEYWIGVDRVLRNKQEGIDLLETWIETRQKYAGYPALLGSGSTLNQAHSMNARDMALMELTQFDESRIAVLLGVPPFLVGLAGATGSLTYSNISDLFDFHDRSSLRPRARMVMEALSGWALPRGQSAELNRDDYTRLPLDKRYAAYKIGIESKFLTIEDVRTMERLNSEQSAKALTGGAD